MVKRVLEQRITREVRNFTQLINFIGNKVERDCMMSGFKRVKSITVYASKEFKPLPHNSSDIYDFEIGPTDEKINVELQFSEKMTNDRLLLVEQ